MPKRTGSASSCRTSRSLTYGGAQPDVKVPETLFSAGSSPQTVAAGASPELISEHAGIGTKAAARYSDHVPSRPRSAWDVITQLKLKRKS